MDRPHRRFNPLTGEWVFVSPHRSQRPWQGAIEPTPLQQMPEKDPDCYLCPGNQRANGQRNPEYTGLYVFDNDFPAFLPTEPGTARPKEPSDASLCVALEQSGICRVLCYSPRHDLSLGQLPQPDVRRVIDLWTDQIAELSPTWRWVQIFENRGAMMGASNPHPHGQVWACDFIPSQVEKEWERQQAFRAQFNESLLQRYARIEAEAGSRTLLQTAHWLIVIPWWALWPYETLILPRREVATLPELTDSERDDLANNLKRLLTGYDALFSTPFPYSFGWHGAPQGVTARDGWQLHAHLYPPLLRSASIKKYMVGFELFAEGQRDLTPEEAAEQLRAAIDSSKTGHP